MIRRHCDLGFVALRKVYGNSAKEPEFRRRNRFRTERTLKDIGSCLEDYYCIAPGSAEKCVFTGEMYWGTR